MARSRLFGRVQRWAAQAYGPAVRMPAPPRRGAVGRRLSRRAFLRSTAAGLAGATLWGLGGCRAPQAGRRPHGAGARVVVVGAGLAGLHAAYRLDQAGVDVTVYEAAQRLGGRTLSARNKLGPGQVLELGGEFIDSEHRVMQALAAEFGEPLDDRLALTEGLAEELYYFGGRLVPEAELVEQFRPVAARMAQAAAQEDDPQAFQRLDRMSIVQWLEQEGQASPLIVALLREAYTGEYGLEAEEQSAWNLLWLIDYEHPQPLRLYGDSDERFRLHRGNEAIAAHLAGGLRGEVEERVRRGHRLEAIREAGEGYELTFARQGGSTSVRADHVVLAIPFTTLRQVAIEVDLPAEKRQVIDELGYGQNAKVLGRFAAPFWRQRHGAAGSFFADQGLQEFWDGSLGQPGPSAVLTHFAGGRTGMAMGTMAPRDWMRRVLPTVEAVFPGAEQTYQDQALGMHWPSAPLVQGSFACYRVGQARFSGLEGERVGNLHFAGEHCSVDFQGYMEGAAETGLAAAQTILAEVGVGRARTAQRV